MRKRILKWLFGTDDIKEYIGLLVESRDDSVEKIRLIDEHIETLKKLKEEIQIAMKLIKICQNHGIDVDEEIKHIQLDEVNANETLD